MTATTQPLIVTLDIGTGSLRACVYDAAEARTLAVAARHPGVAHPAPHRAEWQPDAWWRAIVDALAEAVERTGRPASHFGGITVTSLRQGFVLVDATGEPLAPGVLNYDRRGAAAIPLIEQVLPVEALYGLTGHWHAPELTLPKLLWFRDQRPDVWRRAAAMLFVHDWALFRLSGELGTNPTMVCAGQMGDVRARTWATGLLDALGLRTDLLPPVFEGGHRLGGLRAEVAGAVGLPAGLPVHVGGGDTQFGCLGVGGMTLGQVVIVGGSTTPLLLTTDRPLFDPLRYPWVSAHLRPGLWAVETNAGLTGMLYRWFCDTFGQAQVVAARAQGLRDYALLDELAAAAPIGSEGLLAVATSPRWAQDTWQRKAPYVLHNFNVGHRLGHVARSILESVCYGVRGNLAQLERVAQEPFRQVLFTGGSANVPLWAQMMADVLGRPLDVPRVAEPAAVAGAQLVLWGQGRAYELPPPPATRYTPDPAHTRRYEPFYQAYLDVFEGMQQHFAAEGG